MKALHVQGQYFIVDNCVHFVFHISLNFYYTAKQINKWCKLNAFYCAKMANTQKLYLADTEKGGAAVHNSAL